MSSSTEPLDMKRKPVPKLNERTQAYVRARDEVARYKRRILDAQIQQRHAECAMEDADAELRVFLDNYGSETEADTGGVTYIRVGPHVFLVTDDAIRILPLFEGTF